MASIRCPTGWQCTSTAIDANQTCTPICVKQRASRAVSQLTLCVPKCPQDGEGQCRESNLHSRKGSVHHCADTANADASSIVKCGYCRLAFELCGLRLRPACKQCIAFHSFVRSRMF